MKGVEDFKARVNGGLNCPHWLSMVDLEDALGATIF